MGLIVTEMTRLDVEAVVATARTEIQVSIDLIRPEAGEEGVVRGLRQSADDIAELGRELLGRYPELTTHVTETAIHPRVLAHKLYGDHARADEILTLNPGLAGQGPLIPGGTELTVYAW